MDVVVIGFGTWRRFSMDNTMSPKQRGGLQRFNAHADSHPLHPSSLNIAHPYLRNVRNAEELKEQRHS